MAHHITKTISNNAYWQINKHLHKQLGLRTTLLLQHFIDLQTKVFGNKEFYQSYKQIEKELTLTEHHIRDSIKKLKEAGIILAEKKGMPAKNHYFVLLNKVEELLSLDLEKSPNKSEIPQTLNISPTSSSNFQSLDIENSTNQLDKNHHTKKRNNKKEIKIKENIKKNTSSSAVSQSEKNILSRLLNDLTQYEDKKKFKIAYNEIVDYGGFDKVFDILNFDDSVINNWVREIKSVQQFVNA